MSADSTTQDNYDEYIQNLSLPRLSDEERDNMEGLLTYEECKKVLETFQNDKSPGEDGFTIEFYNFFFELLGHHLISSFQQDLRGKRAYHLSKKGNHYSDSKRERLFVGLIELVTNYAS